MGYKYKIENSKEGYCFKLFPNNSNTQEIGISNLFQTKNECINALNVFSDLQDILESKPSLFEINNKEGKYYFELNFCNSKYKFFRRFGYYKRYECRNGINRVIKNIKSNIKT